MRFVPVLLTAALVLTLVACSASPELPRFLRESNSLEESLTGGVSAASAKLQQGAGQLSAASSEMRREGDALFKQCRNTADPEERAKLYGEIADDYPGHPRAAEARFLQGKSYYEARAWMAAVETLKQYMTDAPVNPHLAEVEEMIYQSALRFLGQDRGLLGVFSEQGTGLEALRYVPVMFPAGKYADDAILYLARHFRDEGELQRASLYYKELLQRYPDSEWSFEARRELGSTYARRDVGGVYHAGFVDRDPREEVNQEDPKAAAFAGPVKSSLEMALVEYDKYLERIARDPGRRAEYAQRVREVEAEKRRVREQLAEKDERIAAWYAGQGDQRAAAVYRRSAAHWRGAKPASPAPRPAPPRSQPAPATPPVQQPTQPPVAPSSPRVPPPPPPPAWPPAR